MGCIDMVSKYFGRGFWSRRLVAIVVSCAALQACLAAPSSRLSGKYCLDGIDADSLTEQFSCLYLQSDGMATMTISGVTVDLQWQFLEQNRIKLVGQSTGTGLTLDVSPDQSELVGLYGFARYVRHQSDSHSRQPLPSASQASQDDPQSSQAFSGPYPATPFLILIGFLVFASLLVGLVVMIRRQGDDDF